VAKTVNVLGDIRAEHDRQMLELAFFETPDYRTLIESTERPIVVGRRGTGKSALVYQLRKYWQRGFKTTVVEIVPQEDQVIGIRPLLAVFGTKYNPIKAGARIAWRYALLMEVAKLLKDHGKFSQTDLNSSLSHHVNTWSKLGGTITSRVRQLLQSRCNSSESKEAVIAGLAQALGVADVQDSVKDLLARTRTSFVFLIDQLDEGFEPDELGIGLVGGVVHAAVDLNSNVPGIQAYIFLRDNIFKALASLDPDYSKNIEGRFLRLHWDENQLFALVCARLRIGFNLSNDDGHRKIWNHLTSGELMEKSGFEKCLRLTLYRPRDVLSLLNNAFYAAQKENRETLILKDVESTAFEISNTRFDDLLKEYSAIIPTLKTLTTCFRNRDPELTYKEAIDNIERRMSDLPPENFIQREFEILESAREGIRILYSVGFLGIKDSASSAFTFCHDGRNPSKEFQPTDRLLVHPCYWMALDATKNTLAAEEAAQIHDEYEVEVYSEAPEIRKRRIGQILGELDRIPLGAEGAKMFEDWCLKAVRICFSGPLRNIELHPNKDAPDRRDIVASNQSEKGAWKRVLDDYKSRQVIFEVKNKIGIDPDDFRQLHSYLYDDYGRMGFIITRDKSAELYSGPELDWTRLMFHRNNVLIIKMTGSLLSSLLSKLRNPEKLDPGEVSINKTLDKYTRLYMAGAKLAKPRD
jgi:hypothetical protein